MNRQGMSGQSSKIGANRRDFLRLAGMAAGALATAGLVSAAPETRPPDVLFVAVEDFSPQRLGCYGNTICKTPNIDQFAAESLRFALNHVSAAPCCPSRAALWSGLRPHTTQIFGNGDDWSQILKPGSTMPEKFRDAGYETIRIGKMFHAGSGNRKFDDKDRWVRVIEPGEGIQGAQKKKLPLRGPGAAGKSAGGGDGSPFAYGPSGLDDLEETDGKVATQAIKVLQARQDKPLFLAVGFHATHLVFSAPQKYFDMYPPEKMPIPPNNDADENGMPKDPKVFNKSNPYTLEQWKEAIAAHYACLSFVDAQFGRVMQALKETGRDKNTIVVLWSDHGFILGEHFKWRKGPLFDYSALVCTILNAPGVTKPGSVCQRPTETIDLYPTLLDLCGLPIPDGLEAISMKPLLLDPARPWKKAALTTSGKTGFSVCTGKWRYCEYQGKPEQTELFDRENDPHELKNLAKDPQHAEVVKELSALIAGGWKACLPSA